MMCSASEEVLWCCGGGDRVGWFRVGGGCCCQGSLQLREWEAVLFVAFDSKISGGEDVQCWWVSLWCGNRGRFFNGVLLVGGDRFNSECCGGRSGCGNGRERGNGRLGDVVGGSYGAVDSVTLDVGDGGSAVMGGGGACVGSGMVCERDYCRIPEII